MRIKSGGQFALGMCLVALLVLTGCDNGTKADLKAVGPPLIAVLDRHDVYVKADAKLADAEKNVALRTSELLRKVLDTTAKKNGVKTSSSLPCENSRCGIKKTTFTLISQPSDPSIKYVVSTKALAASGHYFENENVLVQYLRDDFTERNRGVDFDKNQIIEYELCYYRIDDETMRQLKDGNDAGERLLRKFASNGR